MPRTGALKGSVSNVQCQALGSAEAPQADDDPMVRDHLHGGVGYGDFKKRLLQATSDHFAPFHDKRAAITADPASVDRVLAEGAEKARAG